MEVRPFTIHVPDDVLDDLRWRLGHTRFPDEIPGSGWDYGRHCQVVGDNSVTRQQKVLSGRDFHRPAL